MVGRQRLPEETLNLTIQGIWQGSDHIEIHFADEPIGCGPAAPYDFIGNGGVRFIIHHGEQISGKIDREAAGRNLMAYPRLSVLALVVFAQNP